MDILIKPMETDEEIRGKAYVHWKSWHEAYPGLVSPAYLEKLTPEKCVELAYRWRENILVALDEGRVVGFLGYGDRAPEDPGTGEIFALYVLSEYYGTGVGKLLMEAGLEKLKAYTRVCLWVLKENARAVRFYTKFGFQWDGTEMYSTNVSALEIRMVLNRSS
jgi:ribosomal protein S18 acetylase RimI-like enzyme